MKISFKTGSLDGRTEFRQHILQGLPFDGECYLDVDAKKLFDHVQTVPREACDFLLLATAIYGCDKAVPRDLEAEDRWTRRFSLTIPVIDPQAWNAARDEWSECIGFLTGDIWDLSFVAAARKPLERRGNRMKKPTKIQAVSAVSLLSGGLDSFVGAIDYLESNPSKKLVVASHYDGKVAGPKSDQTKVLAVLQKHYPGRIQHIHLRVGLGTRNDYNGYFETSFRSRSLAFVAIGATVASNIADSPEILMPENGAIALNYPLNPSRRGSCSTRTVHPRFLELLNRACRKVGINNVIRNPFALLTKGEVNALVASTPAFLEGYALSNSCAKPGHTMSWDDRTANGCGRCVPCLFRRASLFKVDHDDEGYGVEALKNYQSRADLPADLRSLIDLLAQNPGRREIMRGLMANGSLPASQLGTYADVVTRMIGEVRAWIGAKAPKPLKQIAGVK
jgi:hypothetical protein